MSPTIRTPRLLLRPWRDEDLPAFGAMSADPRVMEHFPETLAREESDARVAELRAHFDRHGFGVWAVEAPGVAAFVGSVGLAVPTFEAHFTPSKRTRANRGGPGDAASLAGGTLLHR